MFLCMNFRALYWKFKKPCRFLDPYLRKGGHRSPNKITHHYNKEIARYAFNLMWTQDRFLPHVRLYLFK